VVEIKGQRYQLDIRFRMLQPRELAQAQGFPADYQFTGTKTEQIKQIGNAVPCGLARALVSAVLNQSPVTA
jgi:DNA (cytosine-5)-methyltransferase 1